MATRAAAATAKKTVTITREHLERVIDSGTFAQLQCCAFIDYEGVGNLKSLEDAVALRRAASGNLEGHEDEDGDELIVETEDNDEIDHRGAILVTTIPSQSRVYPYLEGAGFKRLGTFKGNTFNMVTLWGAQVLQPGKISSKETKEEVVIT